MILEAILSDKSLKPSEKPGLLAKALLEDPKQVGELLILANDAKDPDKGSCIEAMEHVTLKNPEFISEDWFRFAIASLNSKAPRVKWESARVIANTANLYHSLIPQAVNNLLANCDHPGTVVRWSAATALGCILKLNLSLNSMLIPAVEAIAEREEKNSIRKIYLEAMKKVTR